MYYNKSAFFRWGYFTDKNFEIGKLNLCELKAARITVSVGDRLLQLFLRPRYSMQQDRWRMQCIKLECQVRYCSSFQDNIIRFVKEILCLRLMKFKRDSKIYAIYPNRRYRYFSNSQLAMKMPSLSSSLPFLVFSLILVCLLGALSITFLTFSVRLHGYQNLLVARVLYCLFPFCILQKKHVERYVYKIRNP